MISKQKLKTMIAYMHIGKTLFAVVLVCAYAIAFSLFAGQELTAEAAIPKYINFQGKLTQVSNGNNVANGNYAFRFKLYDASTSGTLLWTETFDQPSGACGKLAVTNGVFNAKLGSCGSPDLLSAVDFTGGALYLTVDFAPTGTSYDGEMSPRKQLVASAFSFIANGVSGDGKVNVTPGQSATALTVARSGTDYALQVDTNTASSATGLKVTAAAAGNGLALTTISSGTNENLTLDAKGSGTVSIGATSTGDVLFGGGSGSTGCTVTNSNGNFTCSATIQGTTLNGTSAIQLNGTDINTAGTLTNVAYENQANTFTLANIFQSDVDLTLADTENLTLTNTVTSTNSVDLFSTTLTNQTSSGTQRGIVLTNANDAANAVTENLILIDNAETTAATLTDAILITSSGVNGGVVDAIDASAANIDNAINIGANAIAGTNFNVSAAGAVVGVGVNAGSGLLQGTGGLTVTGTTNINATGTSATNIGNSTGILTIASGGASSWTNTSGTLAFATATSGNITATTATTSGIFNILTGSLKVGNGTPDTTQDGEDAYIEGTVEIDTLGGGGTVCVTASNTGVLGTTSCSGSVTLQNAYTGGNTISTTSASNIAITLAEVATPTSFTIENQDTAGVSAQRIFNSIASGTLTNGLLIEQTGAGTMTNAIQIAETAGTITDGILITGTLGNILNSGSIDITGAGAITGATGITSATGDITATAGNVAITAGALTLNGTTRISNAGVGTFITGTVIGSQTFTTNNISDSGALTVNATSAALTLQTTTSGNVVLNSAGGTIELQDSTNVTGALDVSTTLAVGTADAFTVNSSGAITAVVGITNTGAQSTTVQSATALTVARTGTNYAFQVDTNTASSATGLKVTSAAAAGGVALAAISSGTDENLTLDAKGAGTVSIGATSTGSILFAGGSGSSGCTITTSGALTCDGNITGPSTGTVGYWSRSGTTISPATSGDVLSVPGVGSSSEKFGASSAAAGASSVAVGNSASSAGDHSTAVGFQASSATSGSVALGRQAAVSTNAQGVAIGYGATTSGSNAVSLAVSASATGSESIAIGSSSSAGHSNVIVLGAFAASTAANQFVAGSSSRGMLDVYFGEGVQDGTPLAYTIHGTGARGGTDTNTAGAALQFAGGIATGNAAGGDIIFQTSDAGASGTAAQSLTTKMILTELGYLGVGDTSPNSLFTVGSGDLFQINSTGQIGSQQAPVSDYLFALAGTTGNDHSRIIDITQANNAAEASTVINIVNTASPGVSSGPVRNLYLSLTPTISSSDSLVYSYGIEQAIDMSNTTLGPGPTIGLNSSLTSGNYVAISGTPVINNTSQTGFAANSYAWASYNSVSITPTLSAATNVNGQYVGTFNSVAVTSSGLANYNPSVYGELTYVSADLTTTANTAHYGNYIDVSGTADANYGLYLTSAGASLNYGLYSNAGTNVMIDDLFIGATSETLANTGFALDGDDLFVSGMAGVEGNIYTDGAFVAGASTTISNGSILQSAGETLTINSGTTAALTLDSGTTGTVNLGTGNNAKTIAIGTGTAGNIINIGTNNTTSDTISIGSALDNVAITGDQWSVTDAGVLTVVSCSGCGGGAVAWNALTNPTGTQSLTFDDAELNSWTVSSDTETFQTITANSLTTGTLLSTSSTALTTGRAQSVTLGGALTTGGAYTTTGASYLHTGTETGRLLNIPYSDTSSNAAGTATTYGISLQPTIATTASAGAKVNYGVSVDPTMTSCGTTGGSCTYHGVQSTTGAITQSTTNNYTLNAFSVSAPGALVQNTAAGTLTWTGMNITMPNITQTTGTVTSTGIKITGGTVSSGTSYALTTDANAGNVGIGTTGPDRRLDVLDASNPQIRLTTTDGSVYADLQNTSTANLILTGDSLTASSGLEYGMRITPTVNQSSSASYRALDVNVTETAATTLSGLNRLIDLRVSDSSKLAVSNTGSLTLQNAANLTTPYGGLGKYENHLVRSEAFDNASWTKTSVTAPTADTQTAPDGSATAESLATSGSGGDVCQFTSTAPSSDTFTFSVWARSTSGTQNFDLRIDAGATSCATANSTTGTAVTHTATASWQRFSVTQTFSGASNFVKARIFPGGTGGTGTIYAWGAQLDKASVPSTYAKTTTATLTNDSRGLIVNNNLKNTTASGFLYGGRQINIIDSTTAGTHIGQFIRMVDNTSLDSGQVVRGLEVQAFSGTNVNGTNTGIASYGYTYGIQAVTTSQAAAQAIPAAVFADLDNGTDATTKTRGNAIRAYTNDATSADLVYLYQETSAYTGNALLMDLGNGAGSFASGNFINLKNAGTSKLTVASTGRLDLFSGDDNIINLNIDTEEATATQTVFAITTDANTADTVKAHIEADGSTFISLTGTTATDRLCWDGAGGVNEEIVDCTGTPGDLAEYFGTDDASIVAGEVVVTSGEAHSLYKDGHFTTKAYIAKSSGAYQANILGVISTQPNEVYADDLFDPSENPRPVALVGRVPVKVTTENGPIVAGDFLTSSSTPGAAMKATKAGPVIGQALEGYDGSAGQIGSVVVFVNTTNYNGVAINEQLTSLSFDYSDAEEAAWNSAKILEHLLAKLPMLDENTLSQINTDVVVAGAEIVTPTVTTQTLRTDFITSATAEGGLSVSSVAIFNGGLLVDSIGSIGGLLNFSGDVEFFGTPYFTSDTAGFAVVKAGVQTVEVKFSREYLAQPIVNASFSFEQDADLTGLDEATITAMQSAQVASAQAFLAEGVTFAITNKSKYGFTIVLNKPATTDVKFSWTALAVRNASTFMSLDAPVVENSGNVAGDFSSGSGTEGSGDGVVDGGGDGSVVGDAGSGGAGSGSDTPPTVEP